MHKRIIPPDPFQMQILIDAFYQAVEARKDHDRERASYTGSSWGYHGRYTIERMEEKSREAMEKLNEYIDSRIQAYLEIKK